MGIHRVIPSLRSFSSMLTVCYTIPFSLNRTNFFCYFTPFWLLNFLALMLSGNNHQFPENLPSVAIFEQFYHYQYSIVLGNQIHLCQHHDLNLFNKSLVSIEHWVQRLCHFRYNDQQSRTIFVACRNFEQSYINPYSIFYYHEMTFYMLHYLKSTLKKL